MSQDPLPGDNGNIQRGGAGQTRVRHWAGFVASGGVAFVVDASVLAVLTKALGLDPFLARLAAIAVAMVAAWLMHRTFTFPVNKPPSLGEFAGFAALASGSNALNYALYSLVLLVRRDTPPLVALVAATTVAMCTSYLGMRFGVFRRVRPHQGPPPT